MATYRKVASGWIAEVCVNGKRKSKTKPTKAEAKSWAAEMEVQLGKSIDSISTTHTMRDLFTRYANEVSEKKKGARWEAVRLEAYKRDELADVLLVDLRREHFNEWINRRLTSVMPSSVNRDLNLISHCLTEARRWRWLIGNPMEDLKRPKNPPHRVRRISDTEIEAVCISLNFDNNRNVVQQQQRVAVAFLLAIETAMRAGEICGMERDHVDLIKRTVHLPDTKNSFSRDVPLSSYAVQLLQMLEPWPLTGPIFGLTSGTLSTLFKRRVDTTGIVNLTFHDSRHEATTRLSKKLEILALAKTTGHRDINQLMVYYNESAEDMAKLLN